MLPTDLDSMPNKSLAKFLKADQSEVVFAPIGAAQVQTNVVCFFND